MTIKSTIPPVLKVQLGLTSKIFSLIFLGLLMACTPNEKPASETDILLDAIRDSLTIELNEIEKKSIIPGFAVAIFNAKKVVYTKGFGYANVKEGIPFTSQSINCVASISKTFIGLAIMKLVETGQLNLDDPINDILPYQIINPHFPARPITVRHLVNHTSSLTADFDPEDVGEADIILLEEIKYEVDSIQQLMDQELAYYKLGIKLTQDEVIQRYLTKNGKWYSQSNFEQFAPGTKYSYSNIGSELASVIVEIKSGMPFDKFTEKNIFGPLQMKNTGWFYEDVDSKLLSKIYFPNNWETPSIAIEHPKYHYNAYSSGGLKTNMEDLSKYVMDMINGSQGKGKLLSPSSYKILFESVLDDTYFDEERDSSPISDEYNSGVFWAVSSSGLRIHNGGSIGVYSFMYFDPNTKSGAIGFCNLPHSSFGKIRDAVYKYERRIFKKKE